MWAPAQYSFVRGGRAAVSAFDAATVAWVAAVITNGGTVSDARKIVVDNLIVGLKADGIFTKLDRLWLLAAENTPSALTDIIATSLATNVNNLTFSVDDGYTGVATAYIDSNFVPTTAPSPNYTINAASFVVWSLSAGQFLGTMIGRNSGSGRLEFYSRFTDNITYYSLNQSTEPGTSNTDGSGCWIGSRTAASVFDVTKNGSSFASDTATANAVPTFNILFFKDAASSTWGGQMACAGFGGALTSGEVTNFYNRLRTYMTAVGVP